MLVYATVDEVEAFTGEPAPSNAAKLIRTASGMVRDITRLARYDTLPNGLPEDDDLRLAMSEAVCAQVESWTVAGIDPVAGVAGREVAVQSQSADGGSVTYTNLPSAEEIRAAVSTLCDLSVSILRDAGLVSTRPLTW